MPVVAVHLEHAQTVDPVAVHECRHPGTDGDAPALEPQHAAWTIDLRDRLVGRWPVRVAASDRGELWRRRRDDLVAAVPDEDRHVRVIGGQAARFELADI